MRVQLSFLAIGICLLTVLSVMSKSRAEGDVADASADVSADSTLSPTAKSDSDATASESHNADTPIVSAEDTERMIDSVYEQDDSRRWDNGVTWANLRPRVEATDWPWLGRQFFTT